MKYNRNLRDSLLFTVATISLMWRNNLESVKKNDLCKKFYCHLVNELRQEDARNSEDVGEGTGIWLQNTKLPYFILNILGISQILHL